MTLELIVELIDWSLFVTFSLSCGLVSCLSKNCLLNRVERIIFPFSFLGFLLQNKPQTIEGMNRRWRRYKKKKIPERIRKQGWKSNCMRRRARKSWMMIFDWLQEVKRVSTEFVSRTKTRKKDLFSPLDCIISSEDQSYYCCRWILSFLSLTW